MDLIEQFYLQGALKEAVQEYIHKHLEKLAVKKVFSREDTKAIAEAKDILDSAFDQINEDYKKKNIKDTKNQCR